MRRHAGGAPSPIPDRGTHGQVECCGNDYDKSFTVTISGVTHAFDSFECAIYTVAPACGHCGCRIVGHGMEVGGRYFCCAHCAHMAGAASLKDRPQIGDHDPAPARPEI